MQCSYMVEMCIRCLQKGQDENGETMEMFKLQEAKEQIALHLGHLFCNE